ncbi:uncharacterized protein LOC121244776 isoform X3 [Juglans microcarpa x Juglans regia]|uniref:uncharacterized protein LOC121244776 isoform X3 n=1 Tax=Juglans microcarpa x Juglans regia TaxID=2249226 RepID=UPI001B7F2EB0|nr:uncharacterized protein LOC121244776 isoform X3 [Juglans microcarpa x Juglans regia]
MAASLVIEASVSASFADNLKGFILALVSSAFIGSSFIIKKLGLQRAGASGPRASSGGYGYLKEPFWWVGMVTMIVGELANFVAYMFAPAVLVTPLGALSIIVSAVLAHFFLKEKLRKMGIVGCVLCIVGSTLIVLHAPSELSLSSVEEIWELATQPDKHTGLYWRMFHNWIIDGYEYQSCRHCYKTHIGGFKPGRKLPNMGFCNGCNYVYYHSAELFEQGCTCERDEVVLQRGACLYIYIYIYIFFFFLVHIKNVEKILTLRREISESGAFQFVGGQCVDSHSACIVPSAFLLRSVNSSSDI